MACLMLVTVAFAEMHGFSEAFQSAAILQQTLGKL